MPPIIGSLLGMLGGGGGGSAPVSATGAPSESASAANFSVVVGSKTKWWVFAIIGLALAGAVLIAVKVFSKK
jgi:hypothetical protein